MWKKALLGLLMTIIILYTYIKITGVNLLIITKLPLWSILGASSFLVLADLLRSLRLWFITHKLRIPLSVKDSIVLWEASRFFAILTPGFYGGEVVRISYIAKRYELSKAVATNLLELLSESIAISISAIVSFIIIMFSFSKETNTDVLYFPVLISLALLAIATSIPATMRCPRRFGERVHSFCLSVVRAIEVAGYITITISVIISIVAITFMALSLGVIAYSLVHMMSLPILIFICSLPITIFPLTPGGIGMPEAIATLALPSLAEALISWRIVNILVVLSSSLFISLIGGILNPRTWMTRSERSHEELQ